MIIGNVIEVGFVPGCRSNPSSVKFRLAAKHFKGDAESTYLRNESTIYLSTIHTPSLKLEGIV
jgi:hypothetical protein